MKDNVAVGGCWISMSPTLQGKKPRTKKIAKPSLIRHKMIITFLILLHREICMSDTICVTC